LNVHYDDSALRRSIDEPGEVEAGLQAHVDACRRCRARRDGFADDADFAARLYSGGAVARRTRPAWIAPAIGLAAAACLVLALAATPLGGVAAQLLTIFEPQQFVPIEMTASDAEQLRLAPRLQRFGTFQARQAPPMQRIASVALAGPTLGFEPRGFAYALPGPKPIETIFVQAPFSTSFTFSAAKARAYESAYKRSLPPMPPELDGTTFRATYGPALVRVFGRVPKDLRDARQRGLDDTVAFVEMRAPRVTSSGATLETAVNYLLSMPNVPPSVAAQLRAIADPEHTLPIPLLLDKARATPVRVDGVQGLAIGDETGLGSAVLWPKNGMVYVIAGSLKQSEALALAGVVK
jgi:hypothetical protein